MAAAEQASSRRHLADLLGHEDQGDEPAPNRPPAAPGSEEEEPALSRPASMGRARSARGADRPDTAGASRPPSTSSFGKLTRPSTSNTAALSGAPTRPATGGQAWSRPGTGGGSTRPGTGQSALLYGSSHGGDSDGEYGGGDEEDLAGDDAGRPASSGVRRGHARDSAEREPTVPEDDDEGQPPESGRGSVAPSEEGERESLLGGDDGSDAPSSPGGSAGPAVEPEASFMSRGSHTLTRAQSIHMSEGEIAEIAARMPRRPSVGSLVYELAWGFPLDPLPPGAVREALVPPPRVPVGWEDTTRKMRRVRGRIYATLKKWDDGCLLDHLVEWRLVAGELREAKELEIKVSGVFHHVYTDVIINIFECWAEYTMKLHHMRKATRKLALWMMKKTEIRAFGAWVAIWAFSKDWRVATLKRCWKDGPKRANKAETELFVKSARGKALISEFSLCQVGVLPELVKASNVDLVSILSLTVQDLLKFGVFSMEDRDKASHFLSKMNRLLDTDTGRLDTLNFWKGEALNNVNILTLSDEDEDEGGEGGEGADGHGKKKRSKKIKGRVMLQTVTVFPLKGAAEVTMKSTDSDLQKDWAWGYNIKLQQSTFFVHSVRVKLLILPGSSAQVHIINHHTRKKLGESMLVHANPGREIEWYVFEFGHEVEGEEELVREEVFLESPGSISVCVHVTRPEDPQKPNQLVYMLDHRPLRRLNHYMICEGASFDGDWRHTPSSRQIPMELILLTQAGLDLDKDPAQVLLEQKEKEKKALVGYADSDAVDEATHEMERISEQKRTLQAVPMDERDAAHRKLFTQLLDKEVLLWEKMRRLLMRYEEKPFEDGLNFMPNRQLSLEMNASKCAAFNQFTQEYWVQHTTKLQTFYCCDLEGKIKRKVQMPTYDINAFTFDERADMFVANSTNVVTRYRPTHPEESDFFQRTWRMEIAGGRFPSGLAANVTHVFVVFMRGTIYQMNKTSGHILKAIHPQFEVRNAIGLQFALGRFIIVDSHAVKVCDMEGNLLQVPMGGQESVGKKRRIRQLTRNYIVNGLDNPLTMWDACYLWVTDSQFRRTDDNQVATQRFGWTCFAPLSDPHPAEYGWRSLRKPDPLWNLKAKEEAEKFLEEKFGFGSSLNPDEDQDSETASDASRRSSTTTA